MTVFFLSRSDATPLAKLKFVFPELNNLKKNVRKTQTKRFLIHCVILYIRAGLTMNLVSSTKECLLENPTKSANIGFQIRARTPFLRLEFLSLNCSQRASITK